MLILGKHSETGEEIVAYQRQEDGAIYFRPTSLFFENVEWEGRTVPIFIFMSDN